MQILLLFCLIIFLSNCATVEVAKEVTKASKSLKTSVDNMLKTSNNEKSQVIKEQNIEGEAIDKEIASLDKEKKKAEKIIKEQRRETKINFLGKTDNEIKRMIGTPELIRVDGNSQTLRFDNNFCQLFLFSNAKTKNAKIKYFEIRDKNGKLIINKEKIKKCYKNFKLI